MKGGKQKLYNKTALNFIYRQGYAAGLSAGHKILDRSARAYLSFRESAEVFSRELKSAHLELDAALDISPMVPRPLMLTAKTLAAAEAKLRLTRRRARRKRS